MAQKDLEFRWNKDYIYKVTMVGQGFVMTRHLKPGLKQSNAEEDKSDGEQKSPA